MIPLKKRAFPMAPPLPFYHPIGHFANSLPPLDATSLGLPVPVCVDDDEVVKGGVGRPQRASTLTDPEGSAELGATIATTTTRSDTTPPAAGAKGTPRKRRTGGGNGAGGAGKRKRKEAVADDGEGSTNHHVMKRARSSRAAAAASAAATRLSVAEELALARGDFGPSEVDDEVDGGETPEPSQATPRARRESSTASDGSAAAAAEPIASGEEMPAALNGSS